MSTTAKTAPCYLCRTGEPFPIDKMKGQLIPKLQ
jgi:hypothetical protein